MYILLHIHGGQVSVHIVLASNDCISATYKVSYAQYMYVCMCMTQRWNMCTEKQNKVCSGWLHIGTVWGSVAMPNDLPPHTTMYHTILILNY